MMFHRLVALGAGMLWACAATAQPVGGPAPAARQQWSFAGPLGHFDLAAVQRGYGVFAGSCASCHSLSQLHFSDFSGMGLQTAEVAALAATWQVPNGLDAEGRLKRRPARPDDALPSPYSGPEAALVANQGVIPPDLSRILKVYPGGPDRLYALLTGYGPQAEREKGRGFFNPYAIGHFTAMPPPLHGNEVKYADGTVPDIQAEARDVTTFLAWVSNPHQDQRRRLGVGVGLYLCFLAVLFAILNRRLWSDVRK